MHQNIPTTKPKYCFSFFNSESLSNKIFKNKNNDGAVRDEIAIIIQRAISIFGPFFIHIFIRGKLLLFFRFYFQVLLFP